MTMREFTHKHLSDMVVTFLGDGRDNVAMSLALGAAKVGIDFRLVSPTALWPDQAFVDHVKSQAWKSGGKFALMEHVGSGVLGADFIYTDVWLSMGENESAWAERIRLLSPFRVTAQVMEATENPYVKFMHCLPAHRGQEVTDSVIESDCSVVFNQAANRLPVEKAILVSLVGSSNDSEGEESSPRVFGRPGHINHHSVAQGKLWL